MEDDLASTQSKHYPHPELRERVASEELEDDVVARLHEALATIAQPVEERSDSSISVDAAEELVPPRCSITRSTTAFSKEAG